MSRSSVSTAAFSPNGRLIAAGCSDSTIRLWDAYSGSEFLRIEGRVLSIAFSPDGRFLAAGGGDRKIHLWELVTGKELLAIEGNDKQVNSVRFSPDGRMLASGGEDGTVRLWEAATGKELARIREHVATVSSVAFSPDGKMLASGSRDGTVAVWDLDSAPGEEPRATIAPEEFNRLWDSLGQEDAARTWAAMKALSGGGGVAVSFLADRLRPAPVGEEISRRLLPAADLLDHDDVRVRERATSDLRELGSRAEPALLKLLDESRPPEAAGRIQGILEGWNNPLTVSSGEPLRRYRAVQILERIGTEGARKALEALVHDPSTLREREEAKASLERLRRRQDAGRHGRPERPTLSAPGSLQ